MSILATVQQLLVGRWKAVRFGDSQDKLKDYQPGISSICFSIALDGNMIFAEFDPLLSPPWKIDNTPWSVLEEDGATFLLEDDHIFYKVISVSQYSMRIATLDKYGTPTFFYDLKRMPNKS